MWFINSWSEAGRRLSKQWAWKRVFVVLWMTGGPALIANLPEDDEHRLVGTGRRFKKNTEMLQTHFIYWTSSKDFGMKNLKLILKWCTKYCAVLLVCNLNMQMYALLTWDSAWSGRGTGSRRPSEGPSALSASPGPCHHPDQWAPSSFSVQKHKNNN